MNKKNILFIALAFILVLAIANVQAFDWTDNITGYLPMDLNGNDLVGNFGAVSNGATLVEGKIDNSYSFDGNDYLNTTNTSRYLQPQDSFSYSIWIKPTKGIGIETIFGRVATDQGHEGATILQMSNRIPWIRYNNLAGTASSNANFTNITLLNNTWTHLVITRNKTTDVWKLYLNGTLTSTVDNTLDGLQVGTTAHDHSTDTYPLVLGSFVSTDYSKETNFTGNLDELGIWNKTLNSTEISELWNGGSGLSYDQNINVTSKLGINPIDNYNSSIGNITFDFGCTSKIAIDYIQLWTNTTGTWSANYSNASYINNTWLNITVTGIPKNTGYLWAVYCNDTTGSEDWSNNRTINYPVPNVTILNEYNPSQVLELSNYIFNITIQRSDNLTEVTPTFYYNNTAYSSGITNTTSGDNITYSKTFNIPYIIDESLFQNKTSYWGFNISYGEASHLQNSTIRNITQHKMELLNMTACSGNYTIDFYNVSYKDETTETALTNINNTWNLELFNPDNTSITRSFNGSKTLSKMTFCVHYATADNYFKVRALTSEVELTNYTSRKDYICEKANTTSSVLDQYLLNSSKDYQKFYFNIKDKYQTNLISSYIYFYKWQSNQWFYLGSEKTDEYGNVVMRLIEDESYKIIIKDGECEVLKEMELTLSCQALPCQVDIILSESQNPYQYLDPPHVFAYVFDYNKDTKIEMFDYEYSGSNLNSVSFKTYKKSLATDKVEVCSNLSSSAENTFYCDVSSYSTGSFISYVYITDDEGKVYTLTYTFDISNAPETFGKEGLIWVILLLVVLFFAFIFNPVAAIFMTVIGLFVVALIGLASLPWIFIVLIIVIAAIIIVKMKS